MLAITQIQRLIVVEKAFLKQPFGVKATYFFISIGFKPIYYFFMVKRIIRKDLAPKTPKFGFNKCAIYFNFLSLAIFLLNLKAK